MDLTLVEQASDVTVVALHGRLDTPGVDRVEARFNAALIRPRKHGIVDMSGVEFLSSMGVRMLLAAAKALGRQGGKLVLVAPRPLVQGALRHSAVDELLPVCDDLTGARNLCAAGAH